MKKTLIYIDPDAPLESIDLVQAMEQMYGCGGSKSYGLCIDTPGDRIMGAFDLVIRIQNDHLDPHDIINVTNCIEELQNKHVFDAILIPATTFGRMLAPRASMRLHVGLVADVTSIRHRNGEVEMVRPAFAGRVLAGVVNLRRVPVMMTVRRNVFSLENRESKLAKILYEMVQRLEPSGVRLVDRRMKPAEHDIRTSDVLVSGGAGVLRHFEQLESLAKTLGGMVSASRKIVDQGEAPRHIQVGQSGKTVSPRLYLALGISGSTQHVVGVKNAEYIISVNPNRRAPICSLSDIVVEGDAREFIGRMVARIERS